MPVTISVSDDVYRRLESFAVGFDTPERVIERLLDGFTLEGSRSVESRPTLTFIPDEVAFKNELLARKKGASSFAFEGWRSRCSLLECNTTSTQF